MANSCQFVSPKRSIGIMLLIVMDAAHAAGSQIDPLTCPRNTMHNGKERPNRFHNEGCVIRSDGGLSANVQDINLVFTSAYTGSIGDAATSIEPIITMVLDEVNDTNVLPGYRLNVHLVDTKCAENAAAKQILRALTSLPPKHGIFGDLCSAACMHINDIVQHFQLLQLTPFCNAVALSDNTRYPYLVRFVPTSNGYAEPVIAMIKAMQWHRVAIITQSLQVHLACVDVVVKRIEAETADGSYRWVLLFSESVATTNQIRGMFDKVITYDARILIVAAYSNFGPAVTCERSRRGRYMPENILLVMATWNARATIDSNGKTGCSQEQIVRGSFGYMGTSVSPMLNRNVSHGLSHRKLSDIRKQYLDSDIFSDGVEPFEFAGYFYDGLWEWVSLLRGFLVDEGRSLDDLVGETSREWLWQQALKANFQGSSGFVRHFNTTSLGDRDGATMLFQQLGLTTRRYIATWDRASGLTWEAQIEWSPDDPTKTLRCSDGSGSASGDAGGRNMSGSSACRFPMGTWIPADQAETCPGGTTKLDMGCVACIAGFSAVAGASSCEPCVAGRFANVSGLSICTKCQAGTFGKLPGASTCEQCLEGSFNGQEGASRCSLCGRGKYIDVLGASACEPCVAIGQGGTVPTTADQGSLFNSSCVCGEGQLRLTDGACRPCDTQAAVCRGLDNQDMIVSQPLFSLRAVGGRASQSTTVPLGDSPFRQMPDAFICISKTDCPGELGPDECPVGHIGVACASCKEGFARSRFRDGCHKCNSEGSWLLVTFVIIVSCLGCLGLVRFTSRKQNTFSLGFIVGSAGGIFFNYIQLIGVLSQLSIEWPRPIGSVLNFLSIVSFDSSLLQVECLAQFGGGGASGASFLHQALVPLALAAALTLVALLWSAGWYIPTHILSKVRVLVVQPDYRCLLSSYILLVTVGFVPVATGGFQIYNCYEHPSGKSSMTSMPAILCFGEDWLRLMLPAGTICMVETLLIYALILTVTWQASTSRVASQRFDMLFSRFRHERFYWTSVIITRNVLLSLTPSFSSNTYLVLTLVTLQLLAYFGLVSWLRPWAYPSHNALDALMSFFVIGFTVICAFFAKTPTYIFSTVEQQRSVVWSALKGTTFLPFPCILATVLWFLMTAKVKNGADMHTAHLRILLTSLADVARRVAPLADKMQEPTVAEALRANSRHLNVQDMQIMNRACALILKYLLGVAVRDVSKKGKLRFSSCRAMEGDVVDMSLLSQQLELAPVANSVGMEAGIDAIEQLLEVGPPPKDHVEPTESSMGGLKRSTEFVGVVVQPRARAEMDFMLEEAASLAETVGKPSSSILGRTEQRNGAAAIRVGNLASSPEVAM